MKHADKNRDPAAARKRAVADLRCAARKLGMTATVAELEQLCSEAGPCFDPQGARFLAGWESR